MTPEVFKAYLMDYGVPGVDNFRCEYGGPTDSQLLMLASREKGKL